MLAQLLAQQRAAGRGAEPRGPAADAERTQGMNAPTWADRERQHIAACELCTQAIANPGTSRAAGTCRTAFATAEDVRCPHPASTDPEARGQICDWHAEAILGAITAYTAANN